MSLGGDGYIPGGTQISVTILLGTILLIAGIVGFAAGDELIVFGVTPLHNAVRALTGLLAIAAGLYAYGEYSDEFNKAAGVVYGLLVVFQAVSPELAEELLNAHVADIWLHIGLMLAFGGVGFLLPDRDTEAEPTAEPTD